MRNIFIEKTYTKCGGEIISRPFSKKRKLTYLWINGLKFVFIVCQVECYQSILKLSCRPLAFTSNKAFIKNKKRSRTILPASFSA